MPARVKNSDVPPEEMSGSGIPLVGTSDSTTLILKNACSRIATVMPKAVRRANGIRGPERHPQAADPEHHEQHNDAHGADEAQFLRDVGEDEVGRRFGQVEELLHAFHEAAPGEAAAAHRDQRLVDVEAGALRIGLGMQKDQHALPAPRDPEQQRRKRRKRGGDAGEEPLPFHARQHQHERGDAGQHQRGAQVRLLHHQQNEHHRDERGAQQRVLPVAHLVEAGVQKPGEKQDQNRLGDFRRLKCEEAAEADPAMGGVRFVNEEDHHQENGRDGTAPGR